jgi:hypothetical protein
MILTAVTTEPFALYHLTWWSYIGAGIAFIGLVWWKIRHWRLSGQILLLTMLAAGAFSFTQVPDASTYAPAAIAFILELENDGSEGEIALLIHIGLVWLILLLLSGSARYGWQYFRNRQLPDSGKVENTDNLSSKSQAQS